MKTVLNEREIKEIEISDYSAKVRYFKNTKEDTSYEMHYWYSEEELGEGIDFCKYCGNRFQSQILENNICPYCGGEQRNIVNPKDVVDMVYSMLQEECVVIITMWDGTKKEFSL